MAIINKIVQLQGDNKVLLATDKDFKNGLSELKLDNKIKSTDDLIKMYDGIDTL